jgi:small subunit ribosomal protein S6
MIDYELMYIVSSSFTDEELSTIEASVGGMLTKVGATATHTERLGKLRMAYPMKGQTHGHYVLIRFQAEPAALAELNNLLRLSPDKVMRHLMLRQDEVGDSKYQLVQFQEVNVEDRPRRGTRGKKDEKDGKVKGEDTKAQKEGVAALEDADAVIDPQAVEVKEEDLDKKIDAALDENA